MEKKPKLLQRNYILINKNQINTRPKTTKERIQDLIVQNEETIKKYEQLKKQSLNSRKSAEYDQIISKYRNQQVHLHNKLYNINLFLNMYLNNGRNNINNIPKPKPKFNNSNNLYLKQYFHKKLNSALKPNFNYSNIYTNSNSSSTKRSFIQKDNLKYNSSISSLIENNKNIITNPIKKINLINNKKKEYKNNYNNINNKYSKIFLNTSVQTRPNAHEYGNNSTLITNVSNKFDNMNKNKYILKSVEENVKLYHSKKNIFIINNINNFYNNNYYGKIKNNSTKNSNSNIQNINLHRHIVNKIIKQKIKDKILKYNIIDEDEKLEIDNTFENEEKIKKNIMNPNIEFSSNPNLFFRKKFYKIKSNVVVELYYSYHDNNELFMALSEKSILGYSIKIIKFKNKIFVTRLKRHNNRIIVIKHFFNRNKMHDYLISGDLDYVVNVWDVSYKYSVNQFIYSIQYNGNLNIYNLLIISFEEKDNFNNYLLIYDKTVNIYYLSEGKYIKKINHYPSKEEKIFNLINWKNKDNSLDYIIKCTKHKIVIFNFVDEDIFFELSNYLRNKDNNDINILYYKSEGCIVSNNKSDYLCILSSSMHLEIWDLYNLSLKEKISINVNIIDDTYLFGIIPWNNKYILLIDGDNNYIYVIDVINNKINSKINGCFRNNIRQIYCKKIIHKKYGESLLVWCYNRYISLFSSNNFSIKIFDE